MIVGLLFFNCITSPVSGWCLWHYRSFTCSKIFRRNGHFWSVALDSNTKMKSFLKSKDRSKNLIGHFLCFCGVFFLYLNVIEIKTGLSLTPLLFSCLRKWDSLSFLSPGGSRLMSLRVNCHWAHPLWQGPHNVVAIYFMLITRNRTWRLQQHLNKPWLIRCWIYFS